MPWLLSMRSSKELRVKKLMAVLMLAILVGCATNAKYQQNIQGWVGLHADQLVDHWGYPTSQIEAPSGAQVYVYEYKQNTPYGNGYFITQECTTHFELDAENFIVKASGQGNACTAK